jgi:hypothetical protein
VVDEPSLQVHFLEVIYCNELNRAEVWVGSMPRRAHPQYQTILSWDAVLASAEGNCNPSGERAEAIVTCSVGFQSLEACSCGQECLGKSKCGIKWKNLWNNSESCSLFRQTRQLLAVVEQSFLIAVVRKMLDVTKFRQSTRDVENATGIQIILGAC